MKPRLLVALTALAMMLSLAGAAVAAPDTVTSVSFSPNSGPVGTVTQMTVQFTAVGGAYNALCIYTVDLGWNANFPASVISNLGDTYAKDPGGPSCPVVSGRTATLYDTLTTNDFADGGDTLNINVTVPSISTGAKAFLKKTNKWSTKALIEVKKMKVKQTTKENFGKLRLAREKMFPTK